MGIPEDGKSIWRLVSPFTKGGELRAARLRG